MPKARKTSRLSRLPSAKTKQNKSNATVALAIAATIGLLLVLLLQWYWRDPNSNDSDERLNTLQTDQEEKRKQHHRKLTPEWIEELIESALKEGISPMSRASVEPIDREATLKKARIFVKEHKLKEAKFLYRHLLEYDPLDKEAAGEIKAIYRKQYPEGPQGTSTKNFTDNFFKVVDRRAKEENFVMNERPMRFKTIRPNLFVIDNFLSDAECDELIRLHDDIVRNRSTSPPLVCLQNDRFVKKSTIASHLIEGTYCLRPALSDYVSAHLNWSHSTSVCRHENNLVDRIEMRIERATGLGHRHARDTQLLSYAKGVSYNDHTDCFYRHHVTDNDKTATFLTYLNDDGLDGGETVFSRLKIGVKPQKGMAVVFYNFRGNECNIDMMHRSSVVYRGRKTILQKWYSYPDAPFLNERVVAPKIKERRPYQATVSCDYILGGGESSCRWYDIWPFPG